MRKKKLLSVICAVTLSMSLTGCGFMEMMGDMGLELDSVSRIA